MFFGRGIIKESESSIELPTELPLRFLRDITNEFSEERKIAEGPFGTFYKGIVPDDRRMITVKKFGENTTFRAGVACGDVYPMVMRLKHENLVGLVGFCDEGYRKLVQFDKRYIQANITQLLICYEYCRYGDLQENLFGIKATEQIMDWNTRFKIIKGICRGLGFLHKCDIPIIHMDLKLENIWLDENLVPKIANYENTMFFGQDQTRLCTQTVVGSYGYMAPEYLYRGEISAKSDIYSLGLMIIEIVTRERYCSENNQPSARNYIEKVQKQWTPNYIASTYSSLGSQSLEQIRLCVDIGLKSVNIDKKLRPPIEEINACLNGVYS